MLCHGKNNTYSFYFAGLKIFMKDYNRLHARRRYQEMPYDCGASVAKYLLCLFNFVFFVSILSFDTCSFAVYSTSEYYHSQDMSLVSFATCYKCEFHKGNCKTNANEI
jgi:hypothetical protein